ncbi:MAG: discoidin domain-containing protein [Bacteroidales bacterium]|nr:discoidin domain-containing protein [Bacteroidales bacterium]
MKKNLLLLVLLCLVTLTQAQQPYAGCYHPEDLKNWVPGEDPNDVFNRSTIPLQSRFVNTAIKANPNSTFSNALVAPDLTLAKDCSKGYAQGRNTFDEMYIFNYWQYVDMVIWWGGSAGEGVFICPTASAIDAAHKNGVKILGNIFFAPTAFGGQAEWVNQTLEKDGAGNYIIADKLIELADYFGFDGWFLNEETKHFSDRAEWENFCAYYSANSDLELQMYNATSSFSASNGWMLRNSAGEETGTSYFVNYGGTGGADSHVSYAQSIGAEAWDLFYGINQGTSTFAGNSGIKSIVSKDNHKASLALFLERAPWRQGNNDDQYDLDENYIHSFFRYSTKYWVGTEEGKVDEDRASQAWSGIANYIPSRTHIQSKPFITNFNSGYGNRRNIKGSDKGLTGQKWVHQGIQDVLPTWRWWWQDAANKELSSELTLSDAYEGGTSIKVSGNLNANDANELRLYKTNLSIDNGDKFKLVFKNSATGSSNIKVGLAFAEDNNAFTYLDAGNATGNWDVKELDLSAYAGKTLTMISLKYVSTQAVNNFTSYIGQIGVLGSTSLSCGKATNLQVQKDLGVDKGDIRLTWDAASGDIQHYNIYLEQAGTKILAGQTPSCAFYLPEIIRTSPSESDVKVYVISVAQDFEESSEASVTVNWKEIPAPEVKIKTTSSFSKANQEITFTAIATNYPESYVWTMPQGAVKVSETADKRQVVYSFPNEGVFDIKVQVTSATATTNFTAEGLVTINNTDELSNVALNKSIADHNGHFGSEQPEKLIDGVTDQGGSEKWCFGGEKEHFVIIDLEKAYKIYRTRLYDCMVNENGPNLITYRAFVSTDNTEGSWKEIYDEEGRGDDDIKDDHFAGIVGRYVKFVPYDVNDAITIRLWEYEVFGLEGPLTIDAPAGFKLDKGSKKNVTVNFDLGNESKASDFKVEVTVPDTDEQQLIEISNVIVNNESVSFDVTANAYGSANFMVKVTNNGWVATGSAKVVIENAAWENLALNRTADKGDDTGYGDEINEITNVLDGDMSTHWAGKLGCTKFMVDLERECTVYKFHAKFTNGIGAYGGGYNKIPGNVTIRYSVDNTNWNELQAAVEGDEFTVECNGAGVQYIELVSDLSGYDHIGLYEVVVTGEEGLPTAIDDVNRNNLNVNIYPNPLKPNSQISVDMPVAGEVSAEIFNIAGSKVAKLQSVVLGEGQHTIKIEDGLINSLKAGIYVVVVNTPSGSKAIKVIKK